MFPSPSPSRIRYAVGILASLSLIAGCTPARSTHAATTQVAHPAEHAAEAASPHVIPVRGDIVGSDGHDRGDFVEGRILPFRASSAPFADKVELYVAAYPTEEFDADMVSVEPAGDGLYTASVRVADADRRLSANQHFDALLVVGMPSLQQRTSQNTP